MEPGSKTALLEEMMDKEQGCSSFKALRQQGTSSLSFSRKGEGSEEQSGPTQDELEGKVAS